jgi:hypothetical protein
MLLIKVKTILQPWTTLEGANTIQILAVCLTECMEQNYLDKISTFLRWKQTQKFVHASTLVGILGIIYFLITD